MVIAVQVGVANAFNRKAAEAWRRRLAARSDKPPQTVEGYRATLARLGALAHKGKPLGLVN